MKQKIKQLQSFFLVLMMLIMGTAGAWATDYTQLFTVTNPGTKGSTYSDTQNNVTVSNGNNIQETNFNGSTNVRIIKVDDSHPVIITSTTANIRKIVFTACHNSSGTSASQSCNVATSADGSTYSTLSSGVSVSGATGTSSTSTDDIYISGYDGSTTVTVEFDTAVRYIKIQKDGKETRVNSIQVYSASGASPTLSSISVKTAPTTTTYTEGDYFSPTGLVITKTMSNSTTEDVAYSGNESDFSFSPTTSTALTTSDTYVTITYGGKSVNQAITVNAASGYTISYSVGTMADGSTAMASAVASAANQTALPASLPTPTGVKTGYTFLHWCTDAALTTQATAGAAIAANTTLYANYKINDTSISPASGDITAGQTLTISAPTGVTLTKAFYKWSSSGTFNKSQMVDSDGNAINSAGTTTTGSFAGTTTTGTTRKVSWVITDGKWWSVAQNTSYAVRTANTLALATTSGSVAVGSTLDISGYISNKNNTSTTVTYTSDNTSVATVTSAGVITGVAAGTTTITVAQAQTDSYTAGSATFTVTVTSAGTTYTVTYNGNGSDGGTAVSDASSPYASGSNVTVKSNTWTKTGYTFSGWNTAANGSGDSYTAGNTISSISGDITLYAQWEAAASGSNFYIISGKNNVPLTAGMNSATYKVLKTNGSTVSATTDISSSQTGTGSLYYNSTSSSYANLTNTSNYSSGSSNARTMQGIKITNGSTMTITLNSKTFSKMDVIYRCASSDANKTLTIDGTGYSTSDTNIHLASITKSFSTSVTISNSSGKEFQVFVILTESAGSATYNVTYNGNGNTSGTVPTDATNYAKNATVTVKTNSGTLAKTGYTFAGWNNKADGTGADFTPAGTFTITKDTTLYAKWTPNEYTVTLNGNGGTGGSASVTATYEAALPSFTAPIRSGYVLTGYYTTASGEGSKVINADGTLVASVDGYTDSNSKWIKADVATLHARWDPVYTVTFNANGGTCATASLTQESYGASIILPNASKDGYNFTGWYETASGTADPVGVAGDSYGASLTANKTLYARFSEIVATTKFSMVREGSTDAELASGAEYTLTGSEATITGAKATGVVVKNLHSDPKQYLSNSNSGCFLLPTNQLYFEINLSTPLAQGDVISYTGYSSKELCFTTSATYDNTISTSEYSYAIPSGSSLIGATTIYVWRAAASSTYFNNLTITTAGSATSTYSVAFNTASIADEIETLEEQTTLPNPLPTPTNVTDGYTFEGWYTNAAFTNAATAGAAINTNTTLYANYIIDTPTITPASGAVYAKTTMTLTSSVPFTKAYGGWTGGSVAYSKAELTNGSHNMYVEGPAIDSFSGFTMSTTAGTQYYTYIISDGTFWSRPAITEAYTVSNIITISAQPQSATYVQTASATALSVTAADSKADATLSYQWKQSTTEDGTYNNVSAGTGGTTASYTPVTTSTGITYYKCVITSNSGAAAVETDVVSVTVNAAAAFTVSFDSGVGCDNEFDDKTQASAGASISLPKITVKDDSRYQFVGWYLDGVKVANAGATTYTPSGNVTLVAKYNCKVTLEKNVNGDGNIPTAKNKSTGETIANNPWVFEGTTITLTASPAENFLNWSVGMTGTENPKDYVVNDYKRFVANYTVPDYKALFHTDFTEDGWSSINGKNGGGTATGVGDDTDAPHNVTMKCGSGISYGWTSGSLTLPGKNYDSENYIAIPVTGVNGELTITVANGSNKTQFKYNVVLGSSTDNPGSSTSSTAAKPSTVTVKGLTGSNYVVYIGRQSGSYAKYTEITITTPTTKLAADSAQVRIMKDPASDTPTATVHITTNSSGPVSIKTDPTSSIATAAYSEGVLTITPKGAGTTSVVMQVAASGGYTARELTIPITVQVPTITINTQPSNIVCYQNDAADKTFTVVATVNTGNDLTYQWYRNTEASTSSPEPTLITGATSSTYTLNTTDKATTDPKYYFCKISSAGCVDVYTNVVSVTVSTLSAGGTYNTVVFAADPGNSVEFDGMTGYSVTSGASTDNFTAAIAGDKLTITGNTTIGSGTVVVTKDEVNTTINVTVKNHTVQLIWSAERRVYDASNWTKHAEMGLDDGTNNGLPVLTRLYEDGSPYTGLVTFYVDDTSMAYFGTEGTGTFVQETPSSKPTIKYGGGQGGCKFYAYIASGGGIEPVKASYDLTMQKGYSNNLPSGRKVEVQQQYTLWKNATDKLITVTYGGYKYNDHKWDGKADSWGTATNYVGKDNAIDGYLYAVRNKDRDAKDEYKHAVQEEDDFGSAWYSTSEKKPDGSSYAAYERIKPFRLPCRASYITFTAHASGTLTAYVYQNGIIGRGTGAGNQLASAPRLGYWFDEEGWVQEPANTVVTKQVIQKGNARDQRSYGGYADMDAQLDGYWKDAADAIIKTKLRSPWCNVAKPNKNTTADAFSLTNTGSYTHPNPYYWGTHTEVEDNLAEVVPTPEHPIPHQGGHMIVNEGYVKYTINVTAGHTYYFFGKMTKVGYAGMNFVEADSENRQSYPDQLDLSTTDNWVTLFGASGTALKNTATTIYDKVTVPSNYRIGKWNTICLPFAVDENQVEKVFGKGTQLAIFNGLREDSENKVYYIKYLRHVDQNILPGQPYLILPTGRAVVERSNQENGGMAETGETIATVGSDDKVIGSTSTGGSGTRIVFNNVIINKGITAQSYGCDVDADGETTSYIFTGTDEQKDIEKYDLYIAPKKGALMRYMPADPATTMPLNSYHAFIKANAPKIKQDAITFAFTEDDLEKSWEQTFIEEDEPGEPTNIVFIEDDGIEDVGNAIVVRHSGKTYNMMGQQVDPRSAKGMVIVNGKKYIK